MWSARSDVKKGKREKETECSEVGSVDALERSSEKKESFQFREGSQFKK